jgi:hypothetical protein
VTRGDHAAGADVVAAVASVIRRVPEEHARGGARGELVGRSGEQVGETATPEHTKLIVGGWNAEEELVWSRGARGAAGAAIEQVRRRLQSFSPERQRCSTVKKHSTQAVVNRAEHAFGLPILLRSIWAGKTQLNAQVREKSAHGIGVILPAIVSL